MTYSVVWTLIILFKIYVSVNIGTRKGAIPSYTIMIFLIGEAYILKMILKRMVSGHRFHNKSTNSNWISRYILLEILNRYQPTRDIHDSLKFKNNIFVLYTSCIYNGKYFHKKCQFFSISVFCEAVSTIVE